MKVISPTSCFRVFAESFVSCDYANNLLVVKTLPVYGPQAAASAVDSLKWADIVGTIAR